MAPRGHPRRSRQLTLDDARPHTGHGGWRRGAGRKPQLGARPHLARPRFPASAPLHVTLKVVAGLPSFRRTAVLRVVRAAIVAGGHRGDFRVVHYNLQGDHLHLIVEAAGATALSRGMQGLTIRLARRLNVLLGRRGRLFAERYHARPLRTPREVRNALRYVLLNARHHATARGATLNAGWVDPYSSALWFDGWKAPLATDAPWLRALARAGCPTAAPHTWLLTGGWRRGGGLIGVDEVPGPAP